MGPKSSISLAGILVDYVVPLKTSRFYRYNIHILKVLALPSLSLVTGPMNVLFFTLLTVLYLELSDFLRPSIKR